jgi:broad specificity phosphatase PhoE
VREAILVRHAESEFSVRGDVNGDPTVPCPLTPTGRKQARSLGRLLARERIDLCVTSEFERVRETADIALAGRDVPRLVVPELNEIRYGSFEGHALTDYRAWARSHSPTEAAPGGGESRAETVERYVRGFCIVLARAEETVLVVSHSLPIRYVLNAIEGRLPVPAVDQVPYAEPIPVGASELEQAIDRLAAWATAPGWAA